MALITQYSDANKQVISPQAESLRTYGYDNSTGVQKKIMEQTITAQYVYTGMTETAAASCYTAVNDPDGGVNARIVWEGGSMFSVEVYVCLVTYFAVNI